MPIDTTIREFSGVVILDIKGKIALGDGSTRSLREDIQKLVEQGKINIILNLGETSYVDQSGVGEIVFGFYKLSCLGGRLKLLSLGQRIKDLFQIAKLYDTFEVFDNEQLAIDSFK